MNVQTRDGCRNISMASTAAIEICRNASRQKFFFAKATGEVGLDYTYRDLRVFAVGGTKTKIESEIHFKPTFQLYDLTLSDRVDGGSSEMVGSGCTLYNDYDDYV